MSNLSDLLPAGASAKQITATDSGSGIASKAPVVLNSDGTVSGISSTSASLGALSANFSGSALAYYCVFTYDTTQDRVVAWWTNMSVGDYPTATVGSISGTTITWGTPVVVISAAMSDYQAATYDSNLDKHLIIFKISSQGKARMGTVTAATNTISFGTTEIFSSSNVSNFDCMYDPSTTKSLIVWRDSGSSPASRAVVATPASDGQITFGSVLNWTYSSNKYAYDICCAYDTNQNKVVVGAWEIPSNYEIANYVATISGTSVTFGARQLAYTTSSHHGYYNNTAMEYDKSANAIVNFWRESAAGKCIAGTISGDSISYGSATAIGSDMEMSHAIYSDQSSSIALSYSASPKVYLQFFSTSGTTITVGSQIEVYSNFWQFNASVYDPDTLSVIVGGNNSGGDNYGYAKVYKEASSNLTAQAFVGVADSAISASAAGSIIVQGGTVTGPTTDVAVAENVGSNIPWGDQSKANSSPVTAYGNNDVLIAYYINDGATRGARVVAGTIGGGTISFGTDDVISADATVLAYRYAIAYDSTNDTYIVSWQDYNDSSKIYAAVVSLTGNSISFGGTTAIVSTANVGNAQTLSAVYDPDTQRVIFTYCSTGDSYAYAVVCEASSTAITTVGTPAIIDNSSATNGYANRIAACYDPTEDKIIATWVYYGVGGYYLRTAAGTVNGGSNSITWGSSVAVISGGANYPYIAYNATDQRVVFNYLDATLTGYLQSSVASVSGTTITVGATPTVILTGTNYYPSVVHDATANKMVTYFRGSLSYAYVTSGAINTATNTITYSTPTLVTSASLSTQNLEGAVYDPTIGKCILVSAGNSVGETACSIYTTATTLTNQPLTTGTKYFVTPTGGFSSTAGTPSVYAGLAISTTSLLLNGDS